MSDKPLPFEDLRPLTDIQKAYLYSFDDRPNQTSKYRTKNDVRIHLHGLKDLVLLGFLEEIVNDSGTELTREVTELGQKCIYWLKEQEKN